MVAPLEDAAGREILSLIQHSCSEAVAAARFLEQPETQKSLLAMARMLAKSFSHGNKLLIAGNGGSLCDAMHVAEEFTGYFRHKRPALPAIALADSSHITCVGNDTSFLDIFSRSIEALGAPGDVFIALTTSGNSENLVRATSTAHKKGLHTIAFLGKTGGALKGKANLELIMPGYGYSDRIQEVHMAALHIVIEAVEYLLFSS